MTDSLEDISDEMLLSIVEDLRAGAEFARHNQNDKFAECLESDANDIENYVEARE